MVEITKQTLGRPDFSTSRFCTTHELNSENMLTKRGALRANRSQNFLTAAPVPRLVSSDTQPPPRLRRQSAQMGNKHETLTNQRMFSLSLSRFHHGAYNSRCWRPNATFLICTNTASQSERLSCSSWHWN